MRDRLFHRAGLGAAALILVTAASAAGQAGQTPAAPATPSTFDLGEVVVVGQRDGDTGVGGARIDAEQIRTFEKLTLDEAINLAPGVSSTLDGNGRRNESDIFVRGFGRWQVPLMIDGVRIYLPADNRLDFGRFLTSDVAEVQIRKGYASVLDGPGAMGGSINIVTRKPTKAFESEAGVSLGGRDADEMWTGYAMAGTRQKQFYLQGSATILDRDAWSLSGNYQPTAGSLQPAGERLGSDNRDWRINFKGGWTPNDTDEYTLNFTKQSGEKGAPLNVFNNPPIPANTYWRWPFWDVQNTSFLSNTKLGSASYVKTKVYYNTFANGLEAFDDISYTTQSAQGRFSSPYDDHAYGTNIEVGTKQSQVNDIKGAFYYRRDIHKEQQISRPTNPTLSTSEPEQEQGLYTWSLALEDTWHATSSIDVVGGISFDKYEITKAQEYNATAGIFEYPKGGSDAFNWQSAVVWHYDASASVHASVSDRGRFPTIFELYSTRFGTATPNPDLGPERATNLEIGWKKNWASRRTRVEGAVFYSDVRDLIQTVQLPNLTTQTQNVGNGEFWGGEIAADAPVAPRGRAGGNYTFIRRTVTDALQPALEATGVPTHKAFLYLAWQPIAPLTITPSFELAGDRWSDVNNPASPVFPYVRTGAYNLVNLAAEYVVQKNVEVAAGFKNLSDDDYALAWGLPQQGRTFYIKARTMF